MSLVLQLYFNDLVGRGLRIGSSRVVPCVGGGGGSWTSSR
jgi:hypothetical protein